MYGNKMVSFHHSKTNKKNQSTFLVLAKCINRVTICKVWKARVVYKRLWH